MYTGKSGQQQWSSPNSLDIFLFLSLSLSLVCLVSVLSHCLTPVLSYLSYLICLISLSYLTVLSHCLVLWSWSVCTIPLVHLSMPTPCLPLYFVHSINCFSFIKSQTIIVLCSLMNLIERIFFIVFSCR